MWKLLKRFSLRRSLTRLLILAACATTTGCGQQATVPPPNDAAPGQSIINPPTAGASTTGATPQTSTTSSEVTIAAASDLKFALEELLTKFAVQSPRIKVHATYGASGNFFAQLSNRAPFDLYLSADVEYPRKLIAQDLAFPESEFSYAVGHIVVWVPNGSPLTVKESGIDTLLDSSIKKISIANPKHAPYGRAAVAALKSLGIYDRVEDRLVLAENITQAAQFVESGAAEIGIISQSLALAPALKDKGRYWVIPETAHPAIIQGGVILTWAKDRAAAEAVREFLMSDEGHKILEKYGFTVPTP